MNQLLVIDDLDDENIAELTIRLSKDVADAARLMSNDEARYLVDLYYQLQRRRIAANNALRQQRRGSTPEPVATLAYITAQMTIVEKQTLRTLDLWTRDYPLSQWVRSLRGVGPIIAAGLRAHLPGRGQTEPPPTAGHWWRFAGMDPTVKWNRSEKRPWNAQLKTLLWKAANVFVRSAGEHDDALYGRLYYKRKAYEWERNRQGLYAGQAALGFGRLKKQDTGARRWYSGCYPADVPLPGENGDENSEEARAAHLKRYELAAGLGVPMLPPGHIHARCLRYISKIFLSHYHSVAYELHFGQPAPRPYPLAVLGHAHEIPVPNWPMAV